MKTNDPFSTPAALPSAAKPKRTPLAAYSDKDLKTRLKQTNNLLGGQVYLIFVAIVSLLTLPTYGTPTNLVEFLDPLLNFLFATWFLATVAVSYQRKPAAHPMLLTSFIIIFILGLISLIGGKVASLIQMLVGAICFISHWQAKAFFDPDLMPTHQQLRHEIERRQREAAGRENSV